MEYVRISWEKLVKDSRTLASNIQTAGRDIDEIVAISRGGLVIGRLLSDYLSCPLATIAIESYQVIHQTQEPVITESLRKDIRNKTVLLVDDVSDSGKTFEKGMEYVSALTEKKVYTGSLYIKSHTIFTPDFWIENLDHWIIFPYEIQEMYDFLKKDLHDAQKAKDKLLQLGIEEWEF